MTEMTASETNQISDEFADFDSNIEEIIMSELNEKNEVILSGFDSDNDEENIFLKGNKSNITIDCKT